MKIVPKMLKSFWKLSQSVLLVTVLSVITAGAFLLFIIMFSIGHIWLTSPSGELDKEKVVAEVCPLIDSLLAFHVDHGEFPEYFTKIFREEYFFDEFNGGSGYAPRSSPNTWRQWGYQRDLDSQGFSLSIRIFPRRMLVFKYEDTDGSWYIDPDDGTSNIEPIDLPSCNELRRELSR